MNRVTLTGRLTKDPELAERGDTRVCDLRIAENGRNDNPMYIDVAVFGPSAEACGRHLTKGRLVAISGQLRYSQWQAPDGTKRSKHSVIAQRVEFLDPKRDPEASEPVGFES